MSRARDIADFNASLFADDEISGDKVSGGTIGAGTFNGTIGSSATFPAGHVIQTVEASIGSGASSGTIAFDNSKPTITEGTQLVTKSITLGSSSSKVLVSCSILLDGYNNTHLIMALFNGNTDSIYSVHFTDYRQNSIVNYLDSPSTAGAITYSVRVGGSGASSFWYNNTSSGPILGGSANSKLILQEIAG